MRKDVADEMGIMVLDETGCDPSLPLQQGWNHFLIRLAHGKEKDKLQAKLIGAPPDFLNDLTSARQKP
jgi:hypothetical protein